MFNNHLANEEASEKIRERAQEAESYRLRKQLGYDDHPGAQWFLVFTTLIVVIMIGLLL